MKINELLYRYIPSKHYLDYIKEHNISYSDYEVAAILSHCIDDPFVLHKQLELIKENTDDKKLIKEIEDKISYDNYLYNLFKDNNDRQAVYVVSVKDEENEYDIYGYFYYLDSAYEKAKENNKQFKIEKQKVQNENPEKTTVVGAWNPHFDKEAEIERHQPDDYGDELGTILYDEEGNITYFYVKDTSMNNSSDAELLETIYKDNFENVYMFLEHPFEIGDIVKDLKYNKVGIVEISKQDYDVFSKKVKDGLYADDFDCGSIVSYLYDDGHFSHQHPLPIFLEKYEPDKEDEKYELLTLASDLLKHEISLDFFTDVYERYRNKHK